MFGILDGALNEVRIEGSQSLGILELTLEEFGQGGCFIGLYGSTRVSQSVETTTKNPVNEQRHQFGVAESNHPPQKNSELTEVEKKQVRKAEVRICFLVAPSYPLHLILPFPSIFCFCLTFFSVKLFRGFVFGVQYKPKSEEKKKIIIVQCAA